MSFINNLIDRSTAPATDIQPRLRGKFERTAAPSENFAATEDFISNTIRTSQPADEKITPQQRTELVRKVHVTKLVEESSEKISRPLHTSPAKKDELSLPDVRPERPPRFEPSYNLVAARQIEQPHSSDRPADNNVYTQPKMQSAEGSLHFTEPKQQQAASPQPDISRASTIVTKEIHKQLPTVKPTANNVFRTEPSQRAQIKQAPAASFLQKQTAKPEPSRTINISIGKIEVRVSQPPAASAAKPKKEGIPIMGLDEYLQKRNQRGQ